MSVNRYDELLSKLDNNALTKLERSDLGTLNFEEVIPYLQWIRRDIRAANSVDVRDVPPNKYQAIMQTLEQLSSNLNEISSWDPLAENNANQSRNELIGKIKTAHGFLMEHLRPYIRPDYTELEETRSAILRWRDELESVLSDARDSLSQIRVTAVEKGAATISSYYRDSADAHKNAAKGYLWAAGVLGAILIFVVVLVFFWLPGNLGKNGPSIGELVREVSGRVVILLILVAAVAFCARNYRINKHLEVLNRTRYNAIETAALYAAAVTDDARNIVVAELVGAIFNPGDTGYINTDREQMIVENPGSIAGLMGALGRQG